MSWLRIDDGEVLDDRVGDLTDREYRARHALLQYVAREANETGIVHENRVNRAAYSTPNGIRTLTKATLLKLIALGLVERVEQLEDAYLESLGITRPEGTGWLRPSRWERYNPPKDSTNAERQRRYREALRNAVTNDSDDRLGNSPSRADSVRVPVPSPRTNTSLSQDMERTSERERANNEEDRRQAWLERSSRPDVRSPQAFVAAGIRSGGWPDPYVAASNGSARATENGSGSGPAYIAGLIRNGVIADLADLETELTLAGVEDDDRSSLVAQLQLAQQLEGRE